LWRRPLKLFRRKEPPQGKQDGGKDTKSKKKGAARDPQTVEDDIAAAEQRLASVAGELSKPETGRDPARLARLNEDYQKAEARLRELYEEWERAAAEGANA
jgi:flagellar motility protein MotE (MotC chaperone)